MIKKLRNPAIKDAKFIVVPKIYEDELLSSWFIRIAYAHHTHPHTFLQLHLSRNSQIIRANNFDIALSDDEIKILESKSNNINLKQATLKNYNGYLQENIIANGQNSLICSLRFCPKCLKEKIIYFKKNWKIILNTICLKHNCYLHDCCPNCKSKIQISKMFEQKKSFKYCHFCGFDLSNTKIETITASSVFINHTKKLNDIIKKGFVILGNRYIYSFLFFDVILQIIKKIVKHKNLELVKTYDIFKYIDIKKKIPNSSPTHFYLSIKEQFTIFSIIMDLFEEYPIKFKRFILENKICHWQMTRDMAYISYWYDELINGITPREIYNARIITDEEIRNARKYLISQGIEVNKSSMSRITGCNFHSKYNQLSLKGII
jgi:hypothetical protein